MKIKLLTVGAFCVNCAIIEGDSKQVYILDPGSDADEIQAFLNENDLTVAAYLLTHGHADHVHALAEIHHTHPAPVYMHAEDEKWAFGEQNLIPAYYCVPAKPEGAILHPENPADWSKLPPIFKTPQKVLCIETPGHTRGGVCYWFKHQNLCFSGDTLFKGSCGRTDLPGGDARVLAKSLKTIATTLPPKTRIIAGHGEETTIAHELRTNYFLQPPAEF